MGDCISWCNPVFKAVDKLPSLEYATRNHAYILNGVPYVLNEEGNGFIELKGGSGTSVAYDDTPLKERIEALENKEDKDTIYNDKAITDRITSLENKADKDEQTLSLKGNTLSISNGNSVVLPSSSKVKALKVETSLVDELTYNNNLEIYSKAGLYAKYFRGINIRHWQIFSKGMNRGVLFRDIDYKVSIRETEDETILVYTPYEQFSNEEVAFVGVVSSNSLGYDNVPYTFNSIANVFSISNGMAGALYIFVAPKGKRPSGSGWDFAQKGEYKGDTGKDMVVWEGQSSSLGAIISFT